MQHTYGVFESEADHLVELVRRHASLAQIAELGCPACGATVDVEFEENGRGFLVFCDGKPLHITTFQTIAEPPPWWRECVRQPVDTTWHWREWHTFDADGNLTMEVSGWTADGHWNGLLEYPIDDPDYAFWRWVLFESGCTSDLIDDAELTGLRTRFAQRI